METIGVVGGSVDETDVLSWTNSQLRHFIRAHDSVCACSAGPERCAVYRAAHEETFFRRISSNLPDRIDGPPATDDRLPCTRNPQGWDTDLASTGQLLAAIDACKGCLFFATCAEQAREGETPSMVWAAVAYDQDGDPIRISALAAWVRTRDGIRLRDRTRSSAVVVPGEAVGGEAVAVADQFQSGRCHPSDRTTACAQHPRATSSPAPHPRPMPVRRAS